MSKPDLWVNDQGHRLEETERKRKGRRGHVKKCDKWKINLEEEVVEEEGREVGRQGGSTCDIFVLRRDRTFAHTTTVIAATATAVVIVIVVIVVEVQQIT